jgi:hypothetical protein
MHKGKKNTEELIGHVLTDKEFRTKLLADPEVILAAEGYEVSPEVLEALKKINPEDVDTLAQDFEKKFASRRAAI